jgi:hypothetical protein
LTSKPTISPEQAKAILQEVGEDNVRLLARVLKERGTPVSERTLYEWRRNKWRSKGPVRKKRATSREEVPGMALSAEIGMPAAERAILQSALRAMNGDVLVVEATKELFVTSVFIMRQVQAASDQLMQRDQRGMAAIMMACRHMVEEGQDMMKLSQRIADVRHKDLDLAATDVTPKPAEEQMQAKPAAPRQLPFASLAYKLGVIAEEPVKSDDEVVIPMTNGNGHIN